MEKTTWRGRRRCLHLFLLLLSLIVACQTLVSVQIARAQAPDNDAAAAAQILGLINEWRLAEGRWPLRPNPTLELMAADQARFIFARADTIEDPTDFHRDAAGLMPPQRAARPPYNWPSYGPNPARIEIGENAGVGSPAFVMNFWKNSPTHSRAALSDVYREVGIAALPRPDRTFVYIVVFGARPGILTAQVGPQGDTLLLSDERSRFASTPPGDLRVRFFGSDGSSLTPSAPWAAVMPLPRDPRGQIFVLFTSGTEQSLVAVDVERDVAILPASAVVAARPTSTPAPASATPTPLPPSAPIPSATPVVVVATAGPAPAGAIPAVVATATPSGRSLTLIYDGGTLFVLNSTSGALDLSGLSIGNDVGRSTIDRWLAVASFPASAFPAGSCLSVTTLSADPLPPLPCRFLRSLINVSASRAYWTQGEFNVRIGETEVGRCTAAAGRCDVALP